MLVKPTILHLSLTRDRLQCIFFLPLNGQIILKLSFEINFSCYLHVVISDLILIVTRDKAKLFILSKKDEENKS